MNLISAEVGGNGYCLYFVCVNLCHMMSCSNDFKQSHAWQAGCQTKLRQRQAHLISFSTPVRRSQKVQLQEHVSFQLRWDWPLNKNWNHWTSLMEFVINSPSYWRDYEPEHRTQEQLCESCKMESWWKCEITQLRPTKVWRKFLLACCMEWLDFSMIVLRSL